MDEEIKDNSIKSNKTINLNPNEIRPLLPYTNRNSWWIKKPNIR